jgi:hypothetical protein
MPDEVDEKVITQSYVQRSDAARRAFLHKVGRQLEDMINTGSITLHFVAGKYSGKHEVKTSANEAKEKDV